MARTYRDLLDLQALQPIAREALSGAGNTAYEPPPQVGIRDLLSGAQDALVDPKVVKKVMQENVAPDGSKEKIVIDTNNDGKPDTAVTGQQLPNLQELLASQRPNVPRELGTGLVNLATFLRGGTPQAPEVPFGEKLGQAATQAMAEQEIARQYPDPLETAKAAYYLNKLGEDSNPDNLSLMKEARMRVTTRSGGSMMAGITMKPEEFDRQVMEEFTKLQTMSNAGLEETIW